MSINANVHYYNMLNSSSSSGENSYSVLIKKAMAKMPKTYITKKSIDEYYKTAMEKINLKIKAAVKAKKTAEAAEKFIAKAKMAAEKAKEKARKAAAKPKAVKAVKGSKTAKKPRAKKVVGGGDGDNDTITEIEQQILILYNGATEDIDKNTDLSYTLFSSKIRAIIEKLNIINNRETNSIGYEVIAKIGTELNKITTSDVAFNKVQALKIIELINETL